MPRGVVDCVLNERIKRSFGVQELLDIGGYNLKFSDPKEKVKKCS